MKTKLVLGVGAIALVGLIVFRIQAKLDVEEAAAARSQQVAVPSVEIAAPSMRPVERAIPITGTLRPAGEVDLVSRAVGRIVEVKVDLGAKVGAGDVLALVEQDIPVIQLKQANAGLEAAQAALKNAEANAQSAEKLNEGHNIADVQLVGARSGLAAAKAQVKQAEAAVALARESLQNTRITSPIPGVVTRKSVNLGAMVGAGPQPLFRVEDLAHLRLEAELTEADAARVKDGLKVTFSTEAMPDATFSGVVTAFSPSLDVASRRATVAVAVDNGDGRLFGNTFVKGRIEIDGSDLALTVPRAAVLDGGEGPSVFVVDGGVARRKPVKVGASDGLYVAISSGIGASDQVIVTGQTLVRDGEAVSVQAKGEGASPAAR